MGAAAAAGAFSRRASASGPIRVALMTHAQGPHLSAYLEGLAAAEDAGTVALSDPSGETVAAARKALGVKLSEVYTSPAQLLRKERPQLALITMEALLAPPVIDAALEAGCHVMAEKPSCVRLEDFAALARKATARNRNLALALANRVDPVMQEARRIIHAGQIGKLYGIELHIIADQTRLTRPAYHKSWTAQKARAGGGHLIWLGIHWLDLAMWMTSSRIREVASFTANAGGQPIDVEDSAVVALKFDNGTLGTMTSGYYLDKGYHSFIKVWGSHGWLQITKHAGVPMEWYSTKDPEPKVRRYEGKLEPTGYTPFVRNVVRACAGMESAVLTTEDSLYALKTVFACYRAAESGKTQSIT